MRGRAVPSLLVAFLLTPCPGRAQDRGLSQLTRSFVAVDGPVVAFTHATVIDGTGAEARPERTVLVRDGRIAAVGGTEVAVPDGAEVVDMTGKTLIPGLVMAHEHMFYPAGSGNYSQQSISFPRLYLGSGVTTLRTGGSHMPYADINVKAAIDAGRVPGPRMFLTSPYLEGPPGVGIWAMNLVDGPEDARATVRYWAGQGITSFKAFMQLSRAELRAIVDEAHALGLQVTGHLCSITYREAVELGIDNLEHAFVTAPDFVADKRPDACPPGNSVRSSVAALDPGDPAFRSLVALLVERNVALTSTMAAWESYVPGRPPAPVEALDAMVPWAREQYLRQWARVAMQQQSVWPELFAKEMVLEKAFVDAGGLLVMGSDPTGYGGLVAGFANRRGLELLVEGGFTVPEAVRIATLNGATLLHVQGEVGSIEVGKRADLVVVAGDLAASVEAIRDVEMVFRDGVGYDARRLISSVRGMVGQR